MKKISPVIMAIVFLVGLNAAWAEETRYDPMERNLIFIEGEATITVPANGFRLTFGFDVDKGSFVEANKESTRIIDAISGHVKGLGLSNVEVIKGWDVLRQAKISFGQKGRKLFNKLTIEVTNYPEGKLHELISKIVDMGLSVSDLVSLEDASVFVTDDVESKKKEEVLGLALKALQSNAVRAAEAVNKKISAPKRIFVTNEQQVGEYKHRYAMSYDSAYEKSAKMELNQFVNIQKSFRVNAQIVDQIKLSAKVAGIYQIE